MTEKEAFQKGFKVALNYLYYHKPAGGERNEFERFLLNTATIDPAVVQEAKLITSNRTLSNGMRCPPGECPVGGACVLCAFPFAYDLDNFS